MRRRCSPLVIRGLVSIKWLLDFQPWTYRTTFTGSCPSVMSNYCIKNIFFTYSILLGCTPPTLIHEVKKAAPCFPETNLFLAAAFIFISAITAAGFSGKGNRSILGVPDQSAYVETLSASQCTFAPLSTDLHIITWSRTKTNQPQNEFADYLQHIWFSDPAFPDRFIISPTHQAIKAIPTGQMLVTPQLCSARSKMLH